MEWQMSSRRLFSLLFFAVTALISLTLDCGAQAKESEVLALVEAGFPALSREWMSEEYERAAEMIVQDKIPLPDVDQPIGVAIFHRLVSAENFRYYRNK